MEIGSTYKIVETGSKISLSSIQTKKKSGGKWITLKDPILEFEKEDKTTFSTYQTEAKRMLDFKRWVLAN